MRHVVLFSRPSCGLCDEARRVLQAARTAVPFELQEINVETADALELEYGLRIPVVTIDGEERFEIAVEEGEFLDALRVEER